MSTASQVGSIPFSELTDFALGHLSTEDALDLLDRIEGDPVASSDLEFVIGLLNFARRNPLWPESNRTTL
jgi:hypothetical protein